MGLGLVFLFGLVLALFGLGVFGVWGLGLGFFPSEDKLDSLQVVTVIQRDSLELIVDPWEDHDHRL